MATDTRAMLAGQPGPPRTDEHETAGPSGVHRGGNTIHRPAKLLRITTMIRELLEDVRQAQLDEAARERLRDIHDRSRRELASVLSDDLERELTTMMSPFDDTPSQSELRVAQAQLVGWLEGLLHGIQAALFAQQTEDGSGSQATQSLQPGQYL